MLASTAVLRAARRLFLAASFLVALPLFADIQYQPPAPDSSDSVTAILSGTWPSGCSPRNPVVTRSGSQITISLVAEPPEAACIAVVTNWRQEVTLGVLPADRYDVKVVVDGRPYEQRELIVTDAAATFRVVPDVVPVTGGTVDLLASGDAPLATCDGSGCPAILVSVGGVLVPVRVVNQLRLRIDVPAHEKGAVDIVVGAGSRARTARLALHYYDPNQTPDSQLFETVLIPLIFNGAGAYGSLWRTDVRAHNGSDVDVTPATSRTVRYCPEGGPLLDPPSPCHGRIVGLTTMLLDTPDRPRGALLHLPRSSSNDLRFSAFVRDVSRADISFGTELPVVRERDFRTGVLRFPYVPFGDPRYRISLRVYVKDTDSAMVSFAPMLPGGVLLPIDAVRAQRQASDELAFATVDFSSAAFLELPTGLQVLADGGLPMWAFLTVTNNQTQQVTIISPQ